MSYIQRFLAFTNNSFFLFGPRGTGKSTWLAEVSGDALIIDLLDPEEVRKYSARPESLVEVVTASPSKRIIIDEVQKVPELLGVVHQLIERKKGWQFILTGSSARKLKRTGVNLLGGRAALHHLHPFMAAELKDHFNLNQALETGLVPVIRMNKNPAEVLRSYVGLYLKEEVQSEGLVRNIGHFARFLEVISFSHGAVLNLSNIARECGVSRKLVEGYLSVLEDLLLSFTLPVFTKRAKRATVMHSKFYYFDAGVFCYLRAKGPIDSSSEIRGVALEGLVAQHLRAWNDYQGAPYSLYYWRTRAGNEVDFIVYGADGFWAIEVKYSQHINPKDLHGLKAFCEDYPEATPVFLYRGKERLMKGNILCLPIDDFLQRLNPNTPLI